MWIFLYGLVLILFLLCLAVLSTLRRWVSQLFLRLVYFFSILRMTKRVYWLSFIFLPFLFLLFGIDRAIAQTGCDDPNTPIHEICTPEPTWESLYKTGTPAPTEFFDCPSEGIAGWGTVTPNPLWLSNCGHCIPQTTMTPIPGYTSVAVGTSVLSTPVPGGTGTPSPGGTGTPSVTGTPGTAYPTPNNFSGLYISYPWQDGPANPVESSELWEFGGGIIYKWCGGYICPGESIEALAPVYYDISYQVHLTGLDWGGCDDGKHAVYSLSVCDYTATCTVVATQDVYPTCPAGTADFTVSAQGSIMSLQPSANNEGRELLRFVKDGGIVGGHGCGWCNGYARFNYVKVGTENWMATPTPAPTSTPAGSSCAGVNGTGTSDGEGNEGVILPIPRLGPSSCFTVSSFSLNTSAISWIPGFDYDTLDFPGLSVCFRAIEFGELKFLGVNVDLDVLALVMGVVVVLRFIFRT